jgi:hypothetical protein
MVCGTNKCQSYRQIFKDYRILTVTSLYFLDMSCYKIRYKGKMKQIITIHDHYTRSKLNFHVQFCHTVLLKKKSVVSMEIKLHNKVPHSMKNWKTVNSLSKN